MKQLFFIRYGEYNEAGNLTDLGIQSMISFSEKIKPYIENKNICVISADVTRAIESSETISEQLNLHSVQVFKELYVEKEKEFLNINSAIKIIDSIFEEYDIIIAVISREYIEILPGYILKSLGNEEKVQTNLQRGEAVFLDYSIKNIKYIK